MTQARRAPMPRASHALQKQSIQAETSNIRTLGQSEQRESAPTPRHVKNNEVRSHTLPGLSDFLDIKEGVG